MLIIRKEDEKELKLLGGFFSSMFNKNQARWLACEGEAYAVKAVVQHFESQIRQNPNETVLFTDSMPVVQAWRKMLTGRFSSSPRIATFLSTMSTVPIRIEHRPGSSQLLADHGSRNPAPICQGDCQICKFNRDEQKVGDKAKIFNIENEELLDGAETVPFLQSKTWRNIQENDSVHSRLRKLIKYGQEPEKKWTGGDNTTLKLMHTLFLKNNLIIHESGVIMVRTKEGNFGGFSISVPTNLMPGVAFAFHNDLLDLFQINTVVN